MKKAFIFPGQGSQAVEMGKALAEKFSVAAEIFDRANNILGWDLKKIAWEDPNEELVRTDRTQPALFTTSVAALEVLRSFGIEPDAVAGHSIGEYAALYSAKVFDFETGLKLVDIRARAMHSASLSNPGGMAALLGIDLDNAIECCRLVEKEGKGIVSVANINSPGQVVISGETSALDLAIRLSRMRGVTKVVPLKVAGAWHCGLMKSAEEELAKAVDEFKFSDPEIPVIANVTALEVTKSDDIKKLLVKQVCGSVLWSHSIERISQMGAELFIEVGHGGVLSGMMKRIVKSAKSARAGTPEEIEKIVVEVKGE